MSLERFCSILGIAMFGTAKKIQNWPVDLLELYRGVTNDDDRTAQRGKIRNIQLPAIRYFAYYLATWYKDITRSEQNSRWKTKAKRSTREREHSLNNKSEN
jgi:hypothetical protein